MKPLVSSGKQELKNEPRKGVVVAKEENASIRAAVSEGDKYTHETREPFCSACMWEEFKKRQKMAEMNQGMTGEDYVMAEVPDWHDFAGKDKFIFVKRNERKIRRDHVISVEENYVCKARNHGVCIMEERPYVTEIPVGQEGAIIMKSQKQ